MRMFCAKLCLSFTCSFSMPLVKVTIQMSREADETGSVPPFTSFSIHAGTWSSIVMGPFVMRKRN